MPPLNLSDTPVPQGMCSGVMEREEGGSWGGKDGGRANYLLPGPSSQSSSTAHRHRARGSPPLDMFSECFFIFELRVTLDSPVLSIS